VYDRLMNISRMYFVVATVEYVADILKLPFTLSLRRMSRVLQVQVSHMERMVGEIVTSGSAVMGIPWSWVRLECRIVQYASVDEKIGEQRRSLPARLKQT